MKHHHFLCVVCRLDDHLALLTCIALRVAHFSSDLVKPSLTVICLMLVYCALTQHLCEQKLLAFWATYALYSSSSICSVISWKRSLFRYGSCAFFQILYMTWAVVMQDSISSSPSSSTASVNLSGVRLKVVPDAVFMLSNRCAKFWWIWHRH